MTPDERYMKIALKLARRGFGSVEPNPAVGAVIVKNDKIIGAGWHKEFGGQHAEINALENCKKQGANSKGATMFVSLEPCCHFGKTGPCADALIAAKLKKVFVATLDPSKHANGKGVARLRKASIEVDVGICQNEARLLNAPFIKFAKTGKPWVTLKWAQSVDGFLARTDKKRWITGLKSRIDAHKLRRRVSAILVGINTVLKDDPLLTPRPAQGKKPLRIVLDNNLRVPLNCKLLASANEAPVLIVTKNKSLIRKKAKQIISRGAKLLGFPDKTKSNLKFLLKYLRKLGVQRLLVEGGPTIIRSFLKANLADEVIVYIAPVVLATKGRADIEKALAGIDNRSRLHYLNIERLGDDVRINGLSENGLKAAEIS